MRLEWDTAGLKREVNRKARAGVAAAGFVVENAVREELRKPGSGRIYRRRGVQHQASAPGESPATDTAQLINSLFTEISGISYGFRARTVANTEYAYELQVGNEKMAARPYMDVALRNAFPEAMNAFRAAAAR